MDIDSGDSPKSVPEQLAEKAIASPDKTVSVEYRVREIVGTSEDGSLLLGPAKKQAISFNMADYFGSLAKLGPFKRFPRLERAKERAMAENNKVDEHTIVVPKNYQDGILEHPHQVVRSEAVVTCNFALQEPLKKVGQKVPCPKCGEVFDVVQGDLE